MPENQKNKVVSSKSFAKSVKGHRRIGSPITSRYRRRGGRLGDPQPVKYSREHENPILGYRSTKSKNRSQIMDKQGDNRER